MIRVLALLLLLVLPAKAEEVVGALSQNRVSITANFDGSQIFVFGAVKRDAPIPAEADALHVVITVAGPSAPVVVRRKARIFGIWANRDTAVVDEAPSFYAIATTGPLGEIMSETERLRHRVGLDKVVRTVGARLGVELEPFLEAVVRIRAAEELYAELSGAIDLRQETLFSTEVTLPANLVEGDYGVRMFLLRGRQVVHVTETSITVQKDGLERLIYTTAHERPLLYGVLSIAVALLAGWLASEAFRLLRR